VISGVALRKTSTGWEFASEAALENFIWANLPEMFGVTPLKQQHIANGEICDILAVDDDRGLVVLELKNVEDRYLIQQLTRYYANLLAEKPFQAEVDYSRPVRLIAIAPTYHRHNLIDKTYNTLHFELLRFSVVKEDEAFYLLLQPVEQDAVEKYLIPYQTIKTSAVENISEPPELLLRWLGGCTREEQEGFLGVRSKLLACSQRMKETVNRSSIQYGLGKTKLCAEILFQQKSQRPVLFLWLPTPSSYRRPVWSREEPNTIAFMRKPIIGRLRIWTNGQTISHVGHISEGFGKMKTKLEWQQTPPEKRPRSMREGMSSHSDTPVEVERYLRCCDESEKPDFWDTLSDMAIEKWLEKIQR
jgi:RecB family endonuclease NucS